jgi:VanZ family protein
MIATDVKNQSVGYRWAVYLFVSYAIVLMLLSGLKSAEVALAQIHTIEAWLGGDKNMHFTLSAILAVLACFASERVLDLAPVTRTIGVVLLLGLALSVDEALQYTLASRRFELLDLAYGSLGLLTGVLGYLSVTFVRSRFNQV